MSERDELERIIGWSLGNVAGIYDTTDAEDLGVADTIRAAGYRKPRTIDTAEEANALPSESVVRSDAGLIYEKYADEDGREYDYWLMPGEQRAQAATKIDLPATVLYEPSAS